jgi:surface antigen
LSKPNPDSVSDLIAKQVKVYKTKEGDTLKSIAQNFGITQNTIIWANKLSSSQIKPGWDLLILPTDGIIVTANSNTTLPDIARKYNSNVDTIISYNGMANAEAFDEGQIIIIPGGTITPPPAAKPKPKKPRDGKVKPEGVVKPEDVDYGTGHAFPWGYCTWYVATKVHIPFGGNAKVWLKNAQSMGIPTGKIPVPGAVVVTNESQYGHVAYVQSVDEDSFTVSEMNYVKFGKVSTRTISKSSRNIKGFIYP